LKVSEYINVSLEGESVVMTIAGILIAFGLIGIGAVIVMKVNDRKGL
jgi:hypothetical protein